MNAWLEIGISNGVVATVLALLVLAITRVVRRPQVAFALWFLVLAKLLVPGLITVPLGSLRSYVNVDAFGSGAPAVEPANDRLVAAPPPPVDEPELEEPALPYEFDPVVSDDDWTLDEAIGEQEAIVPEPPDADDVAFDAPAFDELAESPTIESLEATDVLPLVESAPLEVWHEDEAPEYSLLWLPAAVAWTWITGTALWCALAAVRTIRFARLLHRAEPAKAELQEEVRRLSAKIGLPRPPRVRLARRRMPPLVWAMTGRATMLLPAELLASLSPSQRATLLAHELAHLARRDFLVRWIELAAVGLYWWHPVAWWARRNLEAAAEQCCDARVVTLLPQSARAYAETLLLTIEYLAEPRRSLPLGASGFSRVGHMHRRLTMILERNITARPSWTLRAALVAVALVVLPIGLHAVWAEPAEESKDATANESAPQAEGTESSSRQDPSSSDEYSVFENQSLEDLESDVASSLAFLGQMSTEQGELVQSTRRRVEALNSQLQKALKAYDSGAGNIDEVLKTLRHRFAAQLDYAKAAGAGRFGGRGDYAWAISNVVAAERARRDTEKLVDELIVRGAPPRDIADARRQLEQFADSVHRFEAGYRRFFNQRVNPTRAANYSPSGGSIGERLDRLEALVRKLVESRVTSEAQPRKTQPAAERRAVYVTKQKAGGKPNKAKYNKPIFDTKRLVDLQEDSARVLGTIWHDATRKYQSAESNYNRMLASRKQYEAVREAWEHDTVTSGQVLDAISRRAQAQGGYATSVCAFSNNATYDLMLAHLISAEQARRDVKQLWGEMADRGAPQKEMEQVKQAYRRFEFQADKLSHALREVDGRKVYRYSHRGAGQKFRITQPAQVEATAHVLEAPANKALIEALAARQKVARVAEARRAELENFEHIAQTEIAQFDKMQQRQTQALQELEAQQRKQLEEAERQLAEVRARTEALKEALEAKRAALRHKYEAMARQYEIQHSKDLELLRKAEAEMKEAIEKARGEASKLHNVEPSDDQPTKKKKSPKPATSDGAQRPLMLHVAPELIAANKALADARAVWKVAFERYQSGGDTNAAQQESRAREMYFHAKAQTQAVLDSYLNSW